MYGPNEYCLGQTFDGLEKVLADEDGKIGMVRIICILFSIIFASQDLQMKTLWSEIKNF